MFNIAADKFSELYTLSDFKESIQCGAFIPDDGSGYFGTETHYSYDFSVWSMLDKMQTRPEGATHIHWYNK